MQDKALAAFLKQYKGNCTKCGKYGHKSAYCPEKLKGADDQAVPMYRQFKGNCFWRGKKGHYWQDYHEVKELCKIQEREKKQAEMAKRAYECKDPEDYEDTNTKWASKNMRSTILAQ